ncbi:MAG: rod shape-determining protein MreD [Clostridia bacterium]|nr:rod shape-determining protein MreD [Clostridia bacterium]MBR5976905.1 rod shape-determining protein MreD [Clostridia bacterium]MBR6479288.1 rod shape-determining protein MreD [Clostridia bacterium]MBR6512845.1 rod shape-determining protein MreD [Clostridia bacterium]
MKREPLSKKQKVLYETRTLFALLVLVCAMLQNTPHLTLTILGSHPLILIPLVVFIGMFEKAIVAALYGMFAGILWDVTVAAGDGYNALILMLFATVASVLISYLMRNNISTALLLSLSAIVIYLLLHWFIFVVCSGATGGFITLVTFYLPTAVYTAVFAPLIYILLRAVLRKIKE